MDKMLLMTSQKNAVLQLITAAGLEPFNFEWRETTSLRTPDCQVSAIGYRGKDYHCLFDLFNGKSFWITHSPGADRSLEDHHINSEWGPVEPYIVNWLAYLKRELEEPDLWARIVSYQLPDGSIPSDDTSNEQFTALEVDQLERSINEVRGFLVENYGDNAEINDKLDYLIESSKRMGRKDWVNICIGSLVSLALAQAFQPEHVMAAWKMIQSALSGIVLFLPNSATL